MTYFDKLFETLEYIANKHKNAFEKYLDEDVKEAVFRSNGNGKEIYIKFNRHQLPEYKKSDFEYLYFNAPNIINEMKFDIDGLAIELELPKPIYCNGWDGDKDDVGGFMIRIPEEWNENFKNKEYKDREESIFYWKDWKCSDEHLKERYKNFNKVIKRYIKK